MHPQILYTAAQIHSDVTKLGSQHIKNYYWYTLMEQSTHVKQSNTALTIPMWILADIHLTLYNLNFLFYLMGVAMLI